MTVRSRWAVALSFLWHTPEAPSGWLVQVVRQWHCPPAGGAGGMPACTGPAHSGPRAGWMACLPARALHIHYIANGGGAGRQQARPVSGRLAVALAYCALAPSPDLTSVRLVPEVVMAGGGWHVVQPSTHDIDCAARAHRDSWFLQIASPLQTGATCTQNPFLTPPNLAIPSGSPVKSTSATRRPER